jgi:tRNA dimethylallyltransferase
LLAAGLAENAKPFDFIGYRELRAVLRGEMQLDAARVAIQQATRRYAKRQLTWFRRDARVRWFEGVGDDPEVQEPALRWLQTEGLVPSRAERKTGV